MKTTTRTLLFAPACLFAAMSLATASFAHETDDAAMKKSMSGQSTGSMEMHQTMAKGQNMRMPMSGNVDKDFAMMMSMHHQHAIDMINVFAKHGQSSELKSMAMKMKAAQTAEIKQLARFAGPMDHAKMMNNGKMMDSGNMMDNGKMKMDHPKMAATEFAALDKNKDGKVSRSEVPASNPLTQHFGMLDGDKDGSLSTAEFAKHHGM